MLLVVVVDFNWVRLVVHRLVLYFLGRMLVCYFFKEKSWSGLIFFGGIFRLW